MRKPSARAYSAFKVVHTADIRLGHHEVPRVPINWRRVIFWALLWWLVYSAPTEGRLDQFFRDWHATEIADTF